MDVDMNKGKDYGDRPRNNVFAGLVLLAVGALLLLRQIGFPFPEWIFSWPMILIAIGIFIGVRHDFKNPGWIIMVGIGGFFLFDQVFMDLSLKRFIAPIIIGAVGIMLILNPNRRRRWDPKKTEALGADIERDVREKVEQDVRGASGFSGQGVGYAGTGGTTTTAGSSSHGYTGDDYLNEVAIFGGVKRQIFSKDFKGGRVSAIFGGAELNFVNADIKGRTLIELNNIFGGTKLVIPASWGVKQEISAIFGGIEDRRQQVPGTPGADPDKLLVIRGTCLFGGLEIRNF
jgi:predicted membrane protein